MSQESKPTFEDFYKCLSGDVGYTLGTLFEFYKIYMKVPDMTVEEFLQLDEIHKNFKVEMVSQRGLFGLTVFRKRF